MHGLSRSDARPAVGLADVLQKPDVARRCAGGREERRRIGRLLGAMRHQMLDEHPSRKRASTETGARCFGEVVIGERSDPLPEGFRLRVPALAQPGNGREVLGTQLLVLTPLVLWPTLERKPPAPFDVELVDERRPQAAGRDVVLFGKPGGLRQARGGVQQATVRPRQMLNLEPEGGREPARSNRDRLRRQADSSSG